MIKVVFFFAEDEHFMIKIVFLHWTSWSLQQYFIQNYFTFTWFRPSERIDLLKEHIYPTSVWVTFYCIWIRVSSGRLSQRSPASACRPSADFLETQIKEPQIRNYGSIQTNPKHSINLNIIYIHSCTLFFFLRFHFFRTLLGSQQNGVEDTEIFHLFPKPLICA